MTEQPLNRRRCVKTLATQLMPVAFTAMATHQSLTAGESAAPMESRATHFPARAKNVIMLFMNGAPSHVDTFDYKPELIRHAGSDSKRPGKMLPPGWKFRQRGDSGLWISDLFPFLSRQADELCLLKGMHGDQPNHPTAERAAHTGSGQFVRPSLGAWSVYGLGTENADLPGFVVMGEGGRSGNVNFGSGFLPARYQATRVEPALDLASAGGAPRRSGRRGNPSSSSDPIPNLKNDTLDRRTQRVQLDLLNDLNAETLRKEVYQPQVEGIMQSYELAFRMQSSMPDLMDLSKETETTKSLYGIGDPSTDSFGTQCLLARRMVESGVRFIELSSGGWDHHTGLKTELPQKCQSIDRPIAGLLADLKQRDLLKDTLVIWAGEFGRTPHATGDGRGHNNKGYTTWMAGGGVKGGFSYGATDGLGYSAVEGRMHAHDWHATILHLLGLDHERLTYRHAGRDFRLTNVGGKVAHDILS
ncbi:MAG: DUF1501 domain-containing protein [Planctomycetota bacterium]